MSTIFALSYSDGTIEYRDRLGLTVLPQTMNDQALVLGQVGFDTPLKRPCESLYISIALDDLRLPRIRLIMYRLTYHNLTQSMLNRIFG